MLPLVVRGPVGGRQQKVEHVRPLRYRLQPTLRPLLQRREHRPVADPHDGERNHELHHQHGDRVDPAALRGRPPLGAVHAAGIRVGAIAHVIGVRNSHGNGDEPHDGGDEKSASSSERLGGRDDELEVALDGDSGEAEGADEDADGLDQG